MNREIKFRAFVFGKIGEPFNPVDSQFMAEGGTFDASTIFMQYTGLKDKNGKEIYEGDIVRLDNHLVEMPVIFKDGAFCIHGYSWFANECEVIGNIYETPEQY